MTRTCRTQPGDPLRSSDVLLKADPLVEEREEDEADGEDEDSGPGTPEV